MRTKGDTKRKVGGAHEEQEDRKKNEKEKRHREK